MATNGLTNLELVEYLGLPESIIDDLGTAQGTTYTSAKNEFLEALYNKVLYQTVYAMDFANPFKKYDSFPVRYGDTIENIVVELPQGYKFDGNATDPFGKAVPSAKTLYASINYEMQYQTTIQDAWIRRAVLSEYGFMNLIDTILATLSRSAVIDEYFGTIKALNNPDIYAQGFEEIEKGSTESETAEIVTKKIVDVASSFTLPKKTNNKLGTMNVTAPNNVLLIIKRTVLNSINLDYLTGVYNLNKVDLVKNMIVVDTFQVEQVGEDGSTTMVGEDLDFIVLDERGFDNHVALQDGGMIYNPKGKYTNHFYNLWKIVSYKYFYNARAFKLVDSVEA